MSEQNIKIVNLEDARDLTNVLKACASVSMANWEDAFREIELPTVEDFDSEEEYKSFMREETTGLIESIRDKKQKLFSGMLDNYNGYLEMKRNYLAQSKEKADKAQIVIPYVKKRIKKEVFITIALTALAPSLISIIVPMGLIIIGFEILIKKFAEHLIKDHDMASDELETIQTPLYEFVSQMREDYHKSNHDLDALQQKVNAGENVMDDLLEIIRPERLSLTREQGQMLQFEGEPKQKVKKEGD